RHLSGSSLDSLMVDLAAGAVRGLGSEPAGRRRTGTSSAQGYAESADGPVARGQLESAEPQAQITASKSPSSIGVAAQAVLEGRAQPGHLGDRGQRTRRTLA